MDMMPTTTLMLALSRSKLMIVELMAVKWTLAWAGSKVRSPTVTSPEGSSVEKATVLANLTPSILSIVTDRLLSVANTALK